MPASKLIVVIGATGGQGGSVTNAFLDDPNWRVRGTTRDSSSSKALALKSRGVEIVQADMDEPTSLMAAFQGANAIFAFSDFWVLFRNPDAKESLKPKPGQPLNEWAKEREAQQLKNVADAAAQIPTLERFVLSSMPNVTKLSGGKYVNVCHFDSKAFAEDYVKDTHPDLWAKTSLFKPGLFLSNFTGDPAGMPQQKEDGSVRFINWADPDLKLPWIVHDVDSGPLVKALVTEPAGKNLIAYREWLTLREIAQTFTEATGNKAEAVQIPLGEFWFPCPPELALEFEEHFAWTNEFGYEGRNDPTVIHPKELNSPPVLGTVAEFFKAQDWPEIFASANRT